MSKDEVLNSVGWGDGYLVSRNTAESTVGAVLQIIEVLGLQHTQEKSVKEIIRSKIYSLWGENSVYIKTDLYSKIKNSSFKVQEEAGKNGLPVSGVGLKDLQ